MQGYPRWAESEKIRHKEDLADVSDASLATGARMIQSHVLSCPAVSEHSLVNHTHSSMDQLISLRTCQPCNLPRRTSNDVSLGKKSISPRL